MSPLEDRLTQCLEAARQGSEVALGQALEICRDYLLRIAGDEIDPQLRGKAGASDLVQETLFIALRDFGRFPGATATEWRAWLRQILLYRILNFARTHKDTAKRDAAREEVPIDDLIQEGKAPAQWTTPSAEVMAAEQAEQVVQALSRLPDHYQTLVQWLYEERLSFEEIGGRLGCSASTARQMWFRIIERLRKEMSVPHV
jgi:RNA polymerase sigma-70 factor (ECF subfamily)